MKTIFDVVDENKDSIANEALIQAEREFLTNDYDQQEVEEILGNDGFSGMKFKDDDGNWKII
jgi:hypothetical protein